MMTSLSGAMVVIEFCLSIVGIEMLAYKVREIENGKDNHFSS